ncbi:MAG: diguanylate cyclase [Candidatus Aminicenantes bacterium]|nr:diguanylate cyclase [Candidatus Aminicenantes bacterium]
MSGGKKRARAAGERPRDVVRESERRYQDLLQHLPVGVYRTTASGRIIEANRALADILGFRRFDDLFQCNVKDLYVRKKARREHIRRLAARLTAFSEFELLRRDGRSIWVRDYPRAVKGADGRVRYIDGILVDVSERKRAEEALLRSEQDYRRLFEYAHDAIVVFAVEGEIILDLNQRACDLYGLSRQEMIGMSLEKVSKDVGQGKVRIRRILTRKTSLNFETVHLRKDGSEMLLEVNAALVTYQGRRAILSIQRDVTRRRLLEQAIRQMAFQDTLTGLPNRALLSDRLVQALSQARRSARQVTLFYIDLDGFKTVNDTFGHRIGDELLRVIGARLTGQLRRSDTVARLGGDEFLVLLPDAGRARDGERIARKLLEEIRRPCHIAGRRLQISGSIGLAIFPRDGLSAETLMKHADQAMYMAKAAGRDDFRRFGGRKGKATTGSGSETR